MFEKKKNKKRNKLIRFYQLRKYVIECSRDKYTKINLKKNKFVSGFLYSLVEQMTIKIAVKQNDTLLAC